MLKNNSLFLPIGSIRAILILIITGFILASIWYQKEVSRDIIIIWSGCIGWYFASKANQDENKKNE